MSKTDKTHPCNLRRAQGLPQWKPCCHMATYPRFTKQRNRRIRIKARAALRKGEEPQPYKEYPY